MTDRGLAFEAIDNFRDYGGYAVAGGGHLRTRRLYRSANLCHASADDLQALDGLELAAVIDLRGPGERGHAPSLLPADFAGRVYEPEVETGGVPPHLEAAVKSIASAVEGREAMAEVYADMPCRPVIIAALREYFRALADSDGPSLIHCAAGKDRTGVAVALFHATMGVHRDDIVADYLLTNTVGHAAERLAAGIAAMRRRYGADFDEATAAALVTVAPRYLDAAFAAIETRYGGFEAYLRDEIGVDAALRERLARRLVV